MSCQRELVELVRPHSEGENRSSPASGVGVLQSGNDFVPMPEEVEFVLSLLPTTRHEKMSDRP